MNPTPPVNDRFLRIDAAAAADGAGLSIGPVSVLLHVGSDGRVVIRAMGPPDVVRSHRDAQNAQVIARPGCLLTPGFVNAHSHLDLTHVGPRPYVSDKGFGGFVDVVRRERAIQDDAIAASVQAGIALSLAGGVVAVGDIAGAPAGRPSLVPYTTLAASSLGGMSFVEFFAIGKGTDGGRGAIWEALAPINDPARHSQTLPMRLGRQPHAPTTVSLAMYYWVTGIFPKLRGTPVATHLAETPEEHEFVAEGGGPQRAFLEILGLWDDSILKPETVWDDFVVDGVGCGKTPVQHLAPVLKEAPFVCAHVNDASDEDIKTLASTPTTVAYCPRASDYFRAQDHFGPHRYREMIAAGINVALGTDSIINLPGGTDRLSTLDEARFLYRRDQTDPVMLLRMATVNGAKALGLNETAFSFKVGTPLAGIVAVPFDAKAGPTVLAAALDSDSAPELLLIGR